MKPVIYTIGHSTHELDYFIELLKEFSINCIVDVRSIAASKFNPQFNKDVLANFLANKKITYLHFAKEFGARHSDPNLLDEDGMVDFDKVRASEDFKKGVERICQGVERGFKIALMCSESEPLDCHRFSMVSIALEKVGFEVSHILKDKTLKSNAQLESQLLKKYDKKLPKPDIFKSNVTIDDQLQSAYKLRNKDIAYSPRANEPEEKYD